MGRLGPDMQDDELIEKVKSPQFCQKNTTTAPLATDWNDFYMQRAQQERIKEYSRNLRKQNSMELDYAKQQ